MPTNWPPPTAPSWPPPEISDTWLSCSDLKALWLILRGYGFTHEAPTPQEQQDFFQGVRCDHNDQVTGRMLVSPSSVRYPVAMCVGNEHKDVLVLWFPYYCGTGGNNYELVG